MRRALLLVALLACAPTASANIYDVYGMGARGLSLGGAMTSLADDYTGTFYNVGALTRSKDVRYGGGFLLTVPMLDIGRARPICLDMPAACDASFGPGGYSNIEAQTPDVFAGFTIGWSIPLGGIFENKLALGVSLYVPTINLIRAESLDPQTPHFYMYQNLPDQLIILLGAAYEPHEVIAFGVGVQVLANVVGAASFRMDVLNKQFTGADLEVEIAPKAAATAGIHLRPAPGLQIGVAYRQELGLEFGLPAEIDAEGAATLVLDSGGSVLYTPHTITAGVSYTFESIGLTLSGEVGWAMWSRAPDPSPRIRVRVGGELVDAFGLDGALDVATDAPDLDLGFRDTWTPRFGVEWKALDWFTLRGGYHYRPTPAPRATGALNYLDNDVHGVSFGLAFKVPDPFGAHPNPMSIELGNQFGIMPRRTVHKNDPLDPVGDLQHSGFTYSLNISINHYY